MAGFNAGEVVERLPYTLKPFADEAGDIPEPSDQMIADFMAAIRDLYKNSAAVKVATGVTEDENLSPAKMLEALNSLDPQDIVTFHQDMAKLYSALCQGKPSAEGLLAVPLRGRQIFYAWISDEVVNPEARTGDGIAPVIKLNAAARG